MQVDITEPFLVETSFSRNQIARSPRRTPRLEPRRIFSGDLNQPHPPRPARRIRPPCVPRTHQQYHLRGSQPVSPPEPMAALALCDPLEAGGRRPARGSGRRRSALCWKRSTSCAATARGGRRRRLAGWPPRRGPVRSSAGASKDSVLRVEKGRKPPCRTGPLTWSPTSTGGCPRRRINGYPPRGGRRHPVHRGLHAPANRGALPRPHRSAQRAARRGHQPRPAVDRSARAAHAPAGAPVPARATRR